MKKNIVRIGSLFACVAISGIALSCSKPGAAKEAATRTVIDHDDESVVIPAKVNRAVVVGVWPLPSVITVFLGSPDRLVGIPPASIGAAKAGLLGELFPSYLNIDSHFLANDTLNVEEVLALSLIHISEPTRLRRIERQTFFRTILVRRRRCEKRCGRSRR